MLAKLFRRSSVAAQGGGAAGRPIVLLVDDDADLRELLGLTLRDRGYHTLEAANGKEGLEVATRERPDLVILDAQMPLLDGFEMLRAMRRQRATANVPVIMLTTRSRHGDLLTGFKSGAQEYLAKPVALEELQAAVKKLLQRAPL